MANYTKEEIAAFKKKDQMNCRQSALKAASLIFEGAGCDMANPTKTVLDDAKEYYAWLYPQEDNKPAAGTASNISLPTPTAVQAKVLEKIAEDLHAAGTKLDIEVIKLRVLDFAEVEYKMRKYPENMGSVETFVKALE